MNEAAYKMALDACRIFVHEHDQTYDGEPMSMEMFKAITLAQKAIELADKE